MSAASVIPEGESKAFSEQWLFTKAQNLAHAAYKKPKLDLPEQLEKLNSQQYQAIRYKQDATIWKNDNLGFQMQCFHTGFQYEVPVDMYLIDGGKAQPFKYSPSLFEFSAPVTAPPADSKGGFSGLRLLAPVNHPGSWEEFLIFQGASYFKALATSQTFGISARGVCINTAQRGGEEFPVFRSFWVQKPAPGDRQLLMYGLLDGPSLTGVYKFRVEPGRSTVMDVECTLFPRKTLSHVGIGPLTSMYYYGAADPTRLDDYRPNVHNSDGLLVWTGGGEWLWRPLVNPERLQYSVFVDRDPKGFGLMQRERSFYAYQDIGARFGNRPSVWVEPLGNWGEGAIDLVELPTRSEIYDNVVAFWRPKKPLEKTGGHYYHYRLHWGWEPPVRSTEAHVVGTHVGSQGKPENRRFVVDFVSGSSCNGCNVPPFSADVRAGEGEIKNITVQPNPVTGGQRVMFDYLPGRTQVTDLRCILKQNGQIISETWVYRWSV
ncbi:MAG: glucan biosynthesis protein [Alphaproteobacteria bacterium]